MDQEVCSTQSPAETQPLENGRKSRWRKWLRRFFRFLVYAILLLILVGTGYVLVTNYRGEAAKKEVLQEIRKRGLETDLSYLKENKTSEESSSLYEARNRDHIDHNTKDGTRFYLAAFELGRPDLADSPEDLPIVGLGDAPDLGDPVAKELAEKLREYTIRHKKYYSLLQKARACDRFSYNLNYLNNPYGEGVPVNRLPAGRVLSGYRQAVRRLSLLALHEQASDNPDKALEACEGVIDINNSFDGDPRIIVWLVRTAAGSTASYATERSLSRTFPTKSALNELRKKLLKELQSVNLKKGFKCEIDTWANYAGNPGIWFYKGGLARTSRSGNHWNGGLIPTQNESGDLELVEQASAAEAQLMLRLSNIWFTLCPGAWKLSFARKIDAHLKWYDKCDLPSEKLTSKVKKQINKEDNPLGRKLVPIKWIIQTFRHKARLKVWATALSVEKYRVEHGKYPGTLAQLQDGPQILEDPFTGNQLKYKHTDSGCIVYSVGENQKDDGGEGSRSTEGRDDIAFRLFDPAERQKN